MNMNNTSRETTFSINCRGKLLELSTPVVVGILNLTPDSFYDGGKFVAHEDALKHVEAMLEEGAGIIDIGGASSRPGAETVSLEEEKKRVLPVIELISKNFGDIVLSVDTFHSQIAQMSVEAGAAIINDISAGDNDSEMLSCIGRLGVPFIAMHKQGSPKTMQEHPEYGDVVVEVLDYFIKKKSEMTLAGIKDMIIDPGFGFGKTKAHNYKILKNLNAFAMLGCPVMVGVSRKRMVNEVLNIKPEDALNGTTVLHTLSLCNGAKLLRAHDVRAAVEAVKIFQMYYETS